MFKKIILHLFVKYAPINEEPSLIKKCLKVLRNVITVIITAWALSCVLLLPTWFSEKRIINGHVIYSSNNVDSGLLQNVLNITEERMKNSAINIPGSFPTIYLYNNDILFHLSTLNFNSDATAVYGAIYKRIHVRLNAVNMYTDGIINQNWLGLVIAHEKIHSLQYKRYGILAYSFVPKWIGEGYAEYASGDAPSDEDYAEWLRRVNTGERINKGFEYWVLVRHAIEEMGYSIDELHNGEVDREVVEKYLLNWLEKTLNKIDEQR